VSFDAYTWYVILLCRKQYFASLLTINCKHSMRSLFFWNPGLLEGQIDPGSTSNAKFIRIFEGRPGRWGCQMGLKPSLDPAAGNALTVDC
jgi:hypothetical protein